MITIQNISLTVQLSEATTGYISPQQHSLLYQNKSVRTSLQWNIYNSETELQHQSHKEVTTLIQVDNAKLFENTLT